MKRIVTLSLLLALAACSSTPEYPGFKTNAYIGKKMAAQKNRRESREGLIHAQPAQGGDNAVCVGEWCSCAVE